LRYNPNFNYKDVEKAIDSIFDMDLDIIIPLPEAIIESNKLAFDREITFYDSFYIALAKELDFTFITSDKKLYKKVKDLEFVSLLSNLNI